MESREWPSIFTDELAAAICDNIEKARPLTLAAEAEGVHRATVYRWMAENEAFMRQVTRARAIGAGKLIDLSLEGGKGSSAAMWHLERRHYDDYIPPRNLDQVGPSEVRITIEGGLPARPTESVRAEKTDIPTGPEESPA